MPLTEIAVLLIAASVCGYIAKLFRQPPLIGYLIAGIGLSAFGLIPDKGNLEVFAQIGITLLLFLVGLEMDINDIPAIGRGGFIVSIVQMLFSFILGFILNLMLGIGVIPSAFIAISIVFSSTVVVIKILSEKNDLASLYGKLSISILLVQDLAAMLLLMFLFGQKSGTNILFSNGLILVKAILIFSLAIALSKKILPTIFAKFFSGNNELLFIGSIAWALGVASFVAGPLGFTFEIGGLIAGLSLSNLPEHLQISVKTRSLRDFFLTVFFLTLGSSLVIGNIGSILFKGVIISVFVILNKLVIVLVTLGFMGFRKRTSFLVGLTISQISEFSLILGHLGFRAGYINQEYENILILVGIFTMIASAYLLIFSDIIYTHLKRVLTLFERRKIKEQISFVANPMHDHVVLVGCDRGGKVLMKYLLKHRLPLLVVDFNPVVSTRLVADNVPVLFGDITDPEILELAQIDHADIVISTISNLHDNMVILEYIKKLPRRPLIVMTSADRLDAVKLYEAGASYVVVPQAIAGEYIRHLVKTYGVTNSRIKRIGKNHFARLIAS